MEDVLIVPALGGPERKVAEVHRMEFAEAASPGPQLARPTLVRSVLQVERRG